MKPHHPKLKQPLFSCGIFRYCTQSVLSPTNTNPPVLPLSDPPPPPPPPPPPQSESSSSSNTSQSFTQWRFSNTSQLRHQSPVVTASPPAPPPPPPVIISDLQELFHVAELQLSTGEESDIIKAIHMLQHNLVNSRAVDGASVTCPPAVMRRVLSCLKDKEVAKPATKVLLALCLGESNRHVAVEEGAVGKVVEALVDLDGGAVAERALAALELLCTVAEGAAELRAHALVGPMMVEVMRRMETTRGRENAIGILAVIYSGAGGDAVGFAPQEEVARVVMLAMQGDCSARGRRKGAQLLKMLQENERLDLSQEVG